MTKEVSPETLITPDVRSKAEKRRAAMLTVSLIILETIQEAGTRGIPSGHLYAALMAHMNIDTYNTIIAALEKTGKIKQSHFLLTAVNS